MKDCHTLSEEFAPFAVTVEELSALVRSIYAAFRRLDSRVTFTARMAEERRSSEVSDAGELPVLLAEKWRSPRLELVFYTHTTSDDAFWHVRLDLSDRSAEMRISGPDSSWCGGVAHVVRDFISQRRRWYFWLKIKGGIPLLAMFMASAVAATSLTSMSTHIMVLSWFICGALGYGLPSFIRSVFPTFVVRDGRDSFFRRYSSEIATAGTIVSAIAAVAALFMSRSP